MKKRKVYIILSIVLITIVGVKLINIKMEKEYEIYMKTPSTYNDTIGMTLPKDSIVLDYDDSHGGFHGDGESHVIIKLSDKGTHEFLKEINKNKKWSSLPIPDKYERIVFGGEFNNVSYGNGYFQNAGHIPRDIKNGIYYFRDRYAENYPKQADINFNERVSYNFTIGVFDLDKNKLYISELDT